MPSNLPEIGARAVVENMPRFDAAMQAVNKALDTAGAKAEQAAKRSSVLDKAYDRMSAAAIRAQSRLGGAMNGMTAAVAGMASKVVAAIGTVATALAVTLAAAIGVAIAGLGALVGAFAALSLRGKSYEGIIDSFERLTASVQISANALMTDLREAAAGTVADMDLLRSANLALAGATGETGKVFGESLPRLLEIARAQARATGQDVDYLFNSLVTGIKRGSPLLIDNTGLMLKIGEANEAYAESIGKTVEQLTAQEAQMALLQATLEAGEASLRTYGDAAETLAEKTARAGAAITNTLDYLSLGLQPVAKGIMDAVNSVLVGIANFTRQAIPYIQAIGEIFLDAIRPLLESIAGVATQLNSPGAARSFFTGAANTFGSFLRGVVMIGAQIIQAVADIANAIADFLIGQSPPPKGPLSKIDQGGRNVMLAWLDGFMGGFSLEPIERVTRQVIDALGPIATFTLQQVEARLAQLDAALKPFQDRLAIVKADFDAISKIGDIALGKIERQMVGAVQALIKGEAGSSAVVRQLDAQRQAIEDTLEAQRRQTEEYELQLAIAEAMQARERALLGIRKGQVPALEQTAQAAKKVAKEAGGKEAGGKAPKEKKGSGEVELPNLPGGGFEGAPLENLFGAASDPSKIKLIRQELEGAFSEGFGDAGAAWETAQQRLQQGGARIEKGLNNLGPRLQTAIEEQLGVVTTIDGSGLAAAIAVGLVAAVKAGKFAAALATQGLGAALSGALNLAIAGANLIIDFATSKIGFALFAAKYYFVTGVQPVAAAIATWLGTTLVPALPAVALGTVALAIGAFAFAVVNYDFRLRVRDWLAEALGKEPFELNAALGINPVLDHITNPETGVQYTNLAGWFQGLIDAQGQFLATANARINLAVEMRAFAAEGAATGALDPDAVAEIMHGADLQALEQAAQDALNNSNISPKIAAGASKGLKKRFGADLSREAGNTGLTEAIANLLNTRLASIDMTPFIAALEAPIVGFTTRQLDAANPSGLIGFFTGLPARLVETFATVEPALITALAEPAGRVLDGLVTRFNQVFSPDAATAGSLALAVTQGITFLATVPSLIGEALQPVGSTVVQTFVNPVVTALNQVLGGFETMMRNLLSAIERFSRELGTGFSDLATATGMVSPNVGGGLTSLAEQIARARGSFSVGRVALAGAAQGGVFGPGALRVHRGEEVIASAANRMTVFPARVVKAMEAIASVAPQTASMVHPSLVQTTTSNVNNSRNFGDFNFYGVQDGKGSLRRWSSMKAFL